MPDTFADGCAIDYEAINELAAVHRAAEQLLRHIAEFGTDKRYIGDSYAALERAVKKARRYRISQDAGRSLGWYVVDRWAPLSEKYLNTDGVWRGCCSRGWFKSREDAEAALARVTQSLPLA